MSVSHQSVFPVSEHVHPRLPEQLSTGSSGTCNMLFNMRCGQRGHVMLSFSDLELCSSRTLVCPNIMHVLTREMLTGATITMLSCCQGCCHYHAVISCCHDALHNFMQLEAYIDNKSCFISRVILS